MPRTYVKKCPDCSSTDIIPIMYGMPGEKMRNDYMEGKIKLGGCCIEVDGNQANRHCKSCEFEWNKDDKFCGSCGDVVMYCKCYEDMYK